MREILFRGKRTKDGVWLYGYYSTMFGLPLIAWSIENKIEHTITYTSDFVDPETLGQYTGLTDRNGRKIFVGDIVRLEHKIDAKDNGVYRVNIPTIIRLSRGEDSFDLQPEYADHGWEVCGCVLDGVETAEVIGNIHDNPDLLEGGDSNA